MEPSQDRWPARHLVDEQQDSEDLHLSRRPALIAALRAFATSRYWPASA